MNLVGPPIRPPRPAQFFTDPGDAGRSFNGPAVVCIGTFDGVHLGHQAILQRGRSVADARGWPLWVLTFHPHPKTVVSPSHAPRLLTEPEERLALVASYGADGVAMLRFDAALARMSAVDFLREVVMGQLRAGDVIVGEDFGFGRAREGNAASLHAWGRQTGRVVEVVEMVPSDRPDERISSSLVRRCMGENDFARALRLLGHPYPVSGRPTPGAGRGKQIGYPTWNLTISEAKLPPPAGVYAAWTDRQTPQPAMAYFGTNPTFGGQTPRLEVNVLSDNKEDRTPQSPQERIWLAEFVRPEVKFDNANDLVRQIAEDERVVRSRLVHTSTEHTSSTTALRERREPASAD